MQAPPVLPPPPKAPVAAAPIEKAFEEDEDGFVKPVHKEPPRPS